jgi:NTE family protein
MRSSSLLIGFGLAALLLAACASHHPTVSSPATQPPLVVASPLPPLKIGLALGGGAVKGFAHVGVIKVLEANGYRVQMVAGTSVGSVIGALYAGGMDAASLQQTALALDEATIRDVKLFGGGVLEGKALEDYVNAQVGWRSIEQLSLPFAVVATRLDTGDRAVFLRGNTGQVVRASSSVPGVFQPAKIDGLTYVDGSVVSPVPVDAARQLGADVVIAVDVSSHVSGHVPTDMLGIVTQAITIMGQTVGRQELARADVVIRPQVDDIGAASFEQRSDAINAGERAALAALPQIRAKIAVLEQARLAGVSPVVSSATSHIDCGNRRVRKHGLFSREKPCS